MAMSLTGGDKLRMHLNGIAEKISRGKAVNVGFLEGAAPEPDGTPVATIAAINEYGNPKNGQPPRPFFRRMIETKKAGWGTSFNAVLKASNMDTAKALALMGEGMRGQLIESINEFIDPPLATSTVQQKGFDKPLINKGHMRDSADYEVKSS
jgi:hypothetical protein